MHLYNFAEAASVLLCAYRHWCVACMGVDQVKVVGLAHLIAFRARRLQDGASGCGTAQHAAGDVVLPSVLLLVRW